MSTKVRSFLLTLPYCEQRFFCEKNSMDNISVLKIDGESDEWDLSREIEMSMF